MFCTATSRYKKPLFNMIIIIAGQRLCNEKNIWVCDCQIGLEHHLPLYLIKHSKRWAATKKIYWLWRFWSTEVGFFPPKANELSSCLISRLCMLRCMHCCESRWERCCENPRTKRTVVTLHPGNGCNTLKSLHFYFESTSLMIFISGSRLHS